MSERTDSRPEVFIVDDDESVRDALSLVFTYQGFAVAEFPEGASFLAAAREHTPACVLLDVNMPGRSGLDILKELDAQHYGAPIFIVSAQGDIPMAVDAIKRGAFDFIEKPFTLDEVVVRVRDAIERWQQPANDGAADGQVAKFAGQERLTPREREVLAQIAGGASNKEAGRLLGISPRTIEVHRSRIMEKLGARNAADLVRIVLSDGRAPHALAES
jgi:FixJ family two-component response regulator